MKTIRNLSLFFGMLLGVLPVHPCATCLGRLKLAKGEQPFFSSEYLSKKPIYYTTDDTTNKISPTQHKVTPTSTIKKEQ